MSELSLSEKLARDHACGDFGKALEGYAERAKKLEDDNELLRDLWHTATESTRIANRQVIELRKELDRINAPD